MRKWRMWEICEEEFIRRNIEELTPEDMALVLDRTERAIYQRMSVMGLLSNPYFSEAEEAYIKENYGKIPTIVIAKNLNREKRSIEYKASQLKVAKGVHTIPNKRSDRTIAFDEYIKKNYQSKTAKEIAKDLNITLEHVKKRVFDLGLKKYKKNINR